MNPVVKTYKRDHLLISDNDLEKRCLQIEKASEKLDFIPEIKFTFSSDEIIYKQKRIKSYTIPKETTLILQLSQNLQLLNDFELVHGDIHQFNILYNGLKLCLIDFEPSLRQIKHGHKIFTSSRPTRSLNDISNKTVTAETDKIAFFIYCHYFYESKFSKLEYKDIMRLRRTENYEMLPIPEKEFIGLSFPEIHQLYFE